MSNPVPPGPPQYQPPQYPQGQYPPPGPVAKKTSPWVWILVAVGVLFVLGIAAVGIGSYLVIQKVKSVVGYDAELMKTNPGLAMAKMAVALNPDLETVSTNDRTGTIVMREKSTGKTTTFRFDADKKSLVIVGDDGKEVQFSASGDEKSGAVEIKTNEGSVKYGAAAGNTAPAWVPVYPGASTQGTVLAQTGDGTQYTFSFKSKDPASKVLTYYQDHLKSAGFTVNVVAAGDSGGMVQAEDSDKKRTIILTVGTSGDGTEAGVTSTEKK